MNVIYKMLALNIDGTLLQSNGKIHKSTKEAIEYVKNKGIYVTLVTQRSFPAAKKIAKSLNLSSELITHGGSFIASKSEQPIMVKRILDTTTFEMVRLLEGFNCQTRVISENFSLSNKLENQNKQILVKGYMTYNDPLFYSQHYVDNLCDTLVNQPQAPLKLEVYFDQPDDLLEVMVTFNQVFHDIEAIKINKHRLDIMPKNALKLDGLSYLCNHLSISMDEVVVIADGMEDLEMLAVAGLGVAMNNAENELKLVADWVTRTNDEQGVAYMVKEHFRHQQPIAFLRKMNIIKN